MPLVSMKSEETHSCCEANPYGWGMSLDLDETQCEALGLTAPLRAGQKVTITASAFVKRSSESVEDDGDDKGNDVSMCLQITDMELSAAPASTKTAADVLYKKGE